MWRMVKIKHEFVSSSREGVLYVSIPYATAATTLLRMLLEGWVN